MRHKQIIDQHHSALSEAKGKREETGRFIGIMIEIKPIITWQERIDDKKKDIPHTPPNTPAGEVEVKQSGGCCVVM